VDVAERDGFKEVARQRFVSFLRLAPFRRLSPVLAKKRQFEATLEDVASAVSADRSRRTLQ
jgi:hypothetical protein